MTGRSMMEDMWVCCGGDLVVEELINYLPDDVLADAARHVAKVHGYSFDGEQEKEELWNDEEGEW